MAITHRLTLSLCLVLGISGDAQAAGRSLGVQVPPGFEVTLFADDDLAHDIYSMTMDSLGRVVVSGAGYVRILEDRNGDGKADGAIEYAAGPATGAQGMYFDGRDLLCTGDDGLLRYRDADGNDRADGPPELVLRIKTGGEHHAHAIERGPDGWWYVLAGNNAEVTADYITLPTSPIKRPSAGTLLRLTPDLSRSEVVAHGFRNAYDFAFHWQGDIFVYDSDDEREVSLPWYRPTRVFQAVPGSHAGWVSRSWKRPDYFFDISPVLARLGRGSPTGVVCYQHHQFPETYRDAIFVLDWTFGRVVALPLAPHEGLWTTQPVTFMEGVGQFGFAPTDICVGPDGDLYVSVGGRGTRGGVYRVTYGGEAAQPAAPAPSDRPQTSLAACLLAPQPLSSWSRAGWLSIAEQLGAARLVQAALNRSLEPRARVRGIEILTEMYGGLPANALERLAADPSPAVRARAAWSIGRSAAPAEELQTGLLLPYLQDKDPVVARVALEALAGCRSQTDEERLVLALVEQAASDSRPVRQAAARAVAAGDDAFGRALAAAARQQGGLAPLVAAFGRLHGTPAVDIDALAAGCATLHNQAATAQMRLDAVRLMQLALGHMGADDQGLAIFDGYRSTADLSAWRSRILEILEPTCAQYPTQDDLLDHELSRLLAMLAPSDPALLDRILEQISSQSHPTDDIHHLVVAARIPSDRTEAQRQKTAQTLVLLGEKLRNHGLQSDSYWELRVGELFAQLLQQDPLLPAVMIRHPDFGLPEHAVYVEQMNAQHQQSATEAFASRISAHADYPWTSEVVLLMGQSSDPEHLALVRRELTNPEVRNAVLRVVANHPRPEDRQYFLQGLEAADVAVLKACLHALEQLPEANQEEVLIALLRTLRRLDADPASYGVREQVARLLRDQTGQDFGFQFGREGHHPQPAVTRRWTEYVYERFPAQAAHLGASGDRASILDRLEEVPWESGDAHRGELLFQKHSCAQCHGGRRALGPALAGASRRFSREDLFTAIADPHRDVSPQYQSTHVETIYGTAYVGLVIYESVDGLILLTPANETLRIEGDEIELRQTLPTSLMPQGLLDDFSAQDLADLYEYLQGL